MRSKVKADLKKAKTINEEINMTITRYEYDFDKINKFKDRLAEGSNTKNNEDLPKFVDAFNYNTNSAYSTAYNSNKKEINLYHSEKSNTDKKISDFNLYEFKSPLEKVQTLETCIFIFISSM